MIPFNSALPQGRELEYIQEAAQGTHLSGDGPFMKKCHNWFEEHYNAPKALMTPSCTAALELAALLFDIQAGDEVIMPSFTFVSTANAFVLRGAKIIFVDVDPLTMNMDASLIEAAITPRTKGIVPVHYAGVSCDMEQIMKLAKQYSLWVVEDAAQAIGAKYKGKPVGVYGDCATFSFHETKNIQCGEGGMLLINNPNLVERAEIIREKGTNRSRFLRGQVDKYTWVELGSSYLSNEFSAAYLFAQLEKCEEIQEKRMSIWNAYRTLFINLGKEELLQYIPENVETNGHIFYMKCKDLYERTEFIKYMKEAGIQTVFHYVPLHTSPAGSKYGRFAGVDAYTTKESERLVRLPMHLGLSIEDRERINRCIVKFFEEGGNSYNPL